jgi:hypothetical protein
MEMALKFAIPGLLVWALYSLAYRMQKPAKIDDAGWHHLRPNLVFHVLLGMSSLLWGFMWILLFNADFSEFADSDQTLPFIAVFALFGLGFFYVLYVGYLRRISWRDGEIRQSVLGHIKQYQISNVTSIDFIEWAGVLRLTFVDGRKLDVSEAMHGVGELSDHIDTIIF